MCECLFILSGYVCLLVRACVVCDRVWLRVHTCGRVRACACLQCLSRRITSEQAIDTPRMIITKRLRYHVPRKSHPVRS